MTETDLERLEQAGRGLVKTTFLQVFSDIFPVMVFAAEAVLALLPLWPMVSHAPAYPQVQTLVLPVLHGSSACLTACCNDTTGYAVRLQNCSWESGSHEKKKYMGVHFNTNIT